ncbi:MAG: bifunctional diaminohydroxyphosphoribosylaminopyrimidine deaminase/5-amino-6-(5-phosphoribosylamino)uracil reductase RibD [Gemmataceae bacterium]
MPVTEDDTAWMRRALELAEHGRGAVEPNPLVGAVIVHERTIVGEGWHRTFGGPHAEVFALEAAGDAARGATLYVTLEPCCHFGKTPPCADAVIRAGIARVVAAMADPFPRVAGGGIAKLREVGIAVDVGVCEAEAVRLNAPYLTLLRDGRPYVHAKWAMTLDGKIATMTGDSKWISGPASRARVHELRGRMDAIVVGAGTVRADDPLLTARPPGPRVATRIVLSRSGTLPAGCQLLRTRDVAPVEVVSMPVPELLTELGRRRMTNVLVEGGAEVFASFFAARAVDELHVFVAPRVLGGRDALSPVGGVGPAMIRDALPLVRWESEHVGDDVYLHGWVR